MRKYIWVTTQVPGFHSWPGAPDRVAFLRELHRHQFHIKVYFRVEDDDRELEFFIQQEALTDCLNDLYEYQDMGYFFGNFSCEMIANDLLGALPGATAVQVSEDNENGAIVYV